MNKLISTALTKKSAQYLFQFPNILLNEFELSLISWISKYVTKFGDLPTLKRLKKQFPDFVSMISNDPLKDIFEDTLLEKRKKLAIDFSNKIISSCELSNDDPSKLVSELQTNLAVSANGVHKYSSFDRQAYLADGRSISFNLPVIDKATGGIMTGELAYIVGRLASKKTTLLEYLAFKWWTQGERILFISNESTYMKVFAYLDAMIGKFNPLKLRNKEIKSSYLSKITNAVQQISSKHSGDILVPEERLSRPTDVIALAEHLQVSMILVDGIYLMRPDFKTAGIYERVTAVSRALKQGALAVNLPVIGVHQTSRKSKGKETIEDDDLAYSDAVGQDGDIIIGVTNEDDMLMIELVKNRWGSKKVGVGIGIKVDYDTMKFNMQAFSRATHYKETKTVIK